MAGPCGAELSLVPPRAPRIAAAEEVKVLRAREEDLWMAHEDLVQPGGAGSARPQVEEVNESVRHAWAVLSRYPAGLPPGGAVPRSSAGPCWPELSHTRPNPQPAAYSPLGSLRAYLNKAYQYAPICPGPGHRRNLPLHWSPKPIPATERKPRGAEGACHPGPAM